MFRNTLVAGVVASVSEASNPYEAYARLVQEKKAEDIVGYMEPEQDKYDPYNSVPDHDMDGHEMDGHEMDGDEMDGDEMDGDEMDGDEMDGDEMDEVCKIMGPEGQCFRTKADLIASGYHGDPIEIDYSAPVFHAKKIDRPLQCEVWALDGECSGRVVKSKK